MTNSNNEMATIRRKMDVLGRIPVGLKPMRSWLSLTSILIATLLFVVSPFDVEPSVAQTSAQAIPTFHSIGIYWNPAGASASNEATLQYRPVGEADWQVGYPLYYNQTDGEYRGSIVHLSPDTAYEIELTLENSATNETLIASTWSEQFPIGQVIELPEYSTDQLVIAQSGSPNGYILYTHAPGASATIDGQNATQTNIVIDASYIIVRGLNLTNAQKHGIWLQNDAHDVVIEENDISGWGEFAFQGTNFGDGPDAAIYSNTSATNERFIVQRNVIHHPRTDTNSWGETRPDVSEVPWGTHPVGPHGMYFYNSGGNHVIRYNTIFSDDEHQYNDCIGGGANFSTQGSPNRDSDIYGNFISHCWVNGIEAEGANRNVRIWGNFIHLTYHPLANRDTTIGPLYIWRNVAGDSRRYPRELFDWDDDPRGSFLKSGSEDTNTDYGVHLFHNTALQMMSDPTANFPTGVNRGPSGPMRHTTTRNNIFQVCCSDGVSVEVTGNVQTNDFDYDLFNADIDDPANGEANGASGVPVYTSNYGMDFVTLQGIFTLDSASPGYDQAQVIPNFYSQNFTGSAPDMGAHEEGMPPMEFGINAYLAGEPYGQAVVDNSALIAADDGYTAEENQSLTVSAPDVLANDAGDSLSAVLDSSPSNGNLTLNGDGSFSYLPNPDFTNVDSFTYHVTDGVTESSSATVTITVDPNQVLIAANDGYTAEENQLFTVSAPGVLANDDGVGLSAVLDSPPSNGNLTLNEDGSFSYLSNNNFNGVDSFTYHVTDGVTESSSATVTITVDPNSGPVLVNMVLIDADADVPISAHDPLIDSAVINVNALSTSELNIRAVTNPDPVGSVVFNLDNGDIIKTESVAPYALFGDSPPGQYSSGTLGLGQHTLTATPYTGSNGGGTAGTPLTISFIVTDAPLNLPPEMTNPGDQSNEQDDNVSLPIVASDPDGDTLDYSASGLPPDLSINSVTGGISGTLTTNSVGAFSVTVTASDGDLSADTSFSWTVSGPNLPPEVTNPGDQSNDQGDSVSLTILASDPNGDALDYSASGLPPDLSINSVTGQVSGALTAASVGAHLVTFTVADGEFPTMVQITWTVDPPNQPPDVINPGDQFSAEGESVSVQIAADDPEDDPLTYNASGLPLGLTMNPTTGEITGSLTANSIGFYNVTVVVSDGEFSPDLAFSWTIGGNPNRPTIDGFTANNVRLVSVASLEGDTVSLQVNASDPNNDPLTHAAAGLPPGLSISPTTGEIFGTLPADSAGNYPVVVTVSDGILSTNTGFTWSVYDDLHNTQGIIMGELKQWHRVTLNFTGPDTSEDAIPNPFTDYRLNVTFTNGSTSHTIPGFFAADGDAANSSATSGNQWRVHFTPDQIGTWTYTASFRSGPSIAVSLDPNAGTPLSFDGASGSFVVVPSDKSGVDLRGQGLLRYNGEHYLQFAGSGAYFLKGGADSPENFLGYDEFDGTYDIGGIAPPPVGYLHQYQAHSGDWQAGDPTWGLDRGKNIIGALNYLSDQGINSVYFITYNIDGGDGQDTWPWTSDTVRDRFDVSKLAQWEMVFSHMDTMGIQLHLLTQETENDQALGDLSLERQLYYRELVARFGHHLAVMWNIGEENSNTNAQRIAFADYIRTLDSYEHPITVHTHNNSADTFYNGLFGNAAYEATSIQGDGIQYNDWAISLRERSAQAGRRWVIFGDEQGPRVEADMSNLDQLRPALWGNLLGGGAGLEWYFGYQGADFGDVQSEDWRVAEPLWQQTRHALDFFHTYLPFWEMEPDNALTQWSGSTARLSPYTFAKVDEIYAIYLHGGSGSPVAEIDLGNSAETFNVWWYDPRSGGNLQLGTVQSVTGPGLQAIGQPPTDINEDWVALVTIDATPVVNVNQAIVTIIEGDNANNTGTIFDPSGSGLTLSASIGVVNDAGDGTWSWSFATDDGPSESGTVTISADGDETSVQATFDLVVNNAAPTAAFASSSQELSEGESATLTFSSPIEPSLADTTAGLSYAYDCTDDGVFEETDSPLTSYECSYLDEGNFTARGHIQDKDGGVTEYTVNLTILLLDSDGDGLGDDDEVNLHNTDPFDADSDDDTLNDGEEVNTYGTDPLSQDSDTDGLTDADEVNVYGTDPLLFDSRIISDYVWLDANGDGLQDAGETGFAGVTVNLYHSDDSLVGGTATDSTGIYEFSEVLPGDYYLEFIAPIGFGFTILDANNNAVDIVDSDADPMTGLTTVFTISPSDIQTFWDAGLISASVKVAPSILNGSEDGITDSYTAVLATRPAANVEVAIVPDAQVSANETTLTFTPDNWFTPQSITVTAEDDILEEGPHIGSVAHTVNSVGDPAYHGLAVESVSMNIIDNDIPNTPPDISADLTLVTVDEFTPATNSGTFSDIDSDAVILTTSIGTVNDTGNGTWSWNLSTDDGPSQSQTVSIFADDSISGVSQATFDLVVDNVAPIASLANETGTITAGESATLVFSDPFDPSPTDTTAGFLYAYDCTDNGIFDEANSTETTFDCLYLTDGTFTARGRIMDKDGGSNDYTVTITVILPNQPPIITNPDPQINGEGDTVLFQVVATDPDDTILQYVATGLPSNLSIDSASGLISGDIDFDASVLSPYTITLTVTDPEGLDDVEQFAWTINNTNRSPQISDPGTQSDTEDDDISLQMVASDPDGDLLTFSADTLPDGLSINTDSGLISGTLSDVSAGSYDVTVTVTDSDLPTETTFTWNVADLPSGPRVVSLTLVNADTDEDILVLTDGDVISLSSLPSLNVNVRADTDPPLVGSVVFGFDETAISQIESVAPYALFGDNPPGQYWDGSLGIGQHTLTATPYEGSGGSGQAGNALIVNFEIVAP